MPDIFEDRSSALDSPGYFATEVIPDDGQDLSITSRALYVGTAGDVRLVTGGGSTVTLRNVAIGILPIRATRVLATGTTASDIVAVW